MKSCKREIDPWRHRLMMGLLLFLFTFTPPRLGSSPWIVGATLLILGHVLIGVWVFIRRLGAVSDLHRSMDFFAFLLMFGAVFSMASPAAWCAFFAGAFSVAILKYRLCLEENLPEGYRAYVREKLRLETPAVVLFALAAMVQVQFRLSASVQRGLEIALFAGAFLFAAYLILVRRIYPPKP